MILQWGVSIKASQSESQLTDKDYLKPVSGELNPAKVSAVLRVFSHMMPFTSRAVGQSNDAYIWCL